MRPLRVPLATAACPIKRIVCPIKLKQACISFRYPEVGINEYKPKSPKESCYRARVPLADVGVSEYKPKSPVNSIAKSVVSQRSCCCCKCCKSYDVSQGTYIESESLKI